MPTLTSKLGIKLPLGDELVSRAMFNENFGIIDAGTVADKGGIVSFQAGADASKPAAGTVGRMYLATDTKLFYRDTGAAWVVMGGGAGEFITEPMTINVPDDYDDVSLALESIADKVILGDGLVTILVAAGHYDYTAPITVDHPFGSRINIVGPTPAATTITGFGAITGSAGNWSVPIKLTSTTGIVAGDYVLLKDTTGGNDFYIFRGVWKVLSNDSPTQITIKHTHRGAAWPTPTISLTGGTCTVLGTVLSFGSCGGLVVSPGSTLGLVDKLAIVGDGSNHDGVLVEQARLTTGEDVGVSGFGYHGVYVGLGGLVIADGVASCGNTLDGFHTDGGVLSTEDGIANGNSAWGYQANNGGCITARSSTASGNGAAGYYAICGSIHAYTSFATNNITSGYQAQASGFIMAVGGLSLANGGDGFASFGGKLLVGSSTATLNGGNGYLCYGGWMECSESTSTSNTRNGFCAQSGGHMEATSTTAATNGEAYKDYSAWFQSSINAHLNVGTPTFDPALETVGNLNALITETTP